MGLLSSYIKTIAVFLIFASFVEIIMPKSGFRKYIDIVLGLIMVIILINPINNIIVNIQRPISDIFIETQTQLDKEILNSEVEKYEAAQQQIIISNYKEQLILQISQLLEQKLNINASSINIDIIEDTHDGNFGSIKSIFISLEAKEVIDNAEINKIKITLEDFYNMSSDNIYIE